MAALLTLRDGTLVLEEAILLALALEQAGHELTARDGALLVSNGSQLTPADRATIRRLKNHLLHIAGYSEPAAS